MANGEQDSYVIFGPTNSGKTAFVGTLNQAVLNRDEWEGNLKLQMFPRSDPMANLIRQINETLEIGVINFAGTAAVLDYEFEFDVFARQRRVFFVDEQKVGSLHVRLRDGPGGVLFPDESAAAEMDETAMEDFKNQMVADLRQAKGAILCIDANDERSAQVFFNNFPSLLAQIGQRTLPFDRLAVCLTKADAFFAGEGRGAMRRAQTTDPAERFRQLLSRPTLRALQNYLPPRATVAVGWVSAFGFVENVGSPNFNPSTGGLRMVPEEGALTFTEAADAWRPFNVLDPFVFLATGRLGGLREWKMDK